MRILLMVPLAVVLLMGSYTSAFAGMEDYVWVDWANATAQESQCKCEATGATCQAAGNEATDDGQSRPSARWNN